MNPRAAHIRRLGLILMALAGLLRAQPPELLEISLRTFPPGRLSTARHAQVTVRVAPGETARYLLYEAGAPSSWAVTSSPWAVSAAPVGPRGRARVVVLRAEPRGDRVRLQIEFTSADAGGAAGRIRTTVRVPMGRWSPLLEMGLRDTGGRRYTTSAAGQNTLWVRVRPAPVTPLR